MTYEAKITLKFDSTWEHKIGSSFGKDILPEEHITMEVPAQDLNTNQLFTLFTNFARAIGHTEMSIMQGACSVAFNDMRSEEEMRKVAEEYDLKLVEDYRDEVCKLEAEVRDLKAKLSRALNSSAEQYTEEEISAMCAENEVSIDTLKNADVVCFDCGSKYGEYHDRVSSVWEGKCNVCGEVKYITESRDFKYLAKGIKELTK
jgi:hypothetical protein